MTLNYIGKLLFTATLSFIIAFEGYSKIYINEVVASNSSIEIDGDFPDWIELYNDSDSPVDLGGYAITDDVNVPQKWIFADGVSIEAKSYLLILANDKANGINTNFKLSASGETISLFDGNDLLIDRVDYPHLAENTSYGRLSDGNEKFVIFESPTPNGMNVEQGVKTTCPTFDVVPGFYESSFTLSIDCSLPSAKIYFTTNGAIPDFNSQLYVSPITIDHSQVVRAIAVVDDMEVSNVATASYFVGEHQSKLPVISIAANPDDFFGNERGIYVRGTNGIEGLCADGAVNWNQDWRRQISMEVFGNDRNIATQLDAEVRIFGGCSRTNNQKSLCITARDVYGFDRINYKFFADKPIDKFKSIVLRNSGNDWQETMFRDALVAELCKDLTHVDYQSYQPSIVYINGEYFGIHNIREKISKHYVAENYPEYKARDIDLLCYESSVIDGDNSDYKILLNFIKRNDLADNAAYQYVANQIDIDEFIDYQIIEIYVANTDWPQNNIKFWRERSSGKWRWILFDTDFGFGIWDKQPNENTLNRALSNIDGQSWPTLLLRKLMANDNFRAQFVQRFAYIISTVFDPTRVSNKIDSISNLIRDEMPYHNKRWEDWSHNMDTWNYYIEHMRDYTKRRPEYMKTMLKQYFKLSGYHQVAIDANMPNLKLNVNGDAIDLPYNGFFFTDEPLNLTVKPDKCYTFDSYLIENNQYHTSQIIAKGDSWQYYDQGRVDDSRWKSDLSFANDWKTGLAPLGYSSAGVKTTISYGPDAQHKYTTTYFRKIIHINNKDEIDKLRLQLAVDDGAIVYINGIEAVRENMPSGKIDYSTYSTTYVGTIAYNAYDIPVELLNNGDNLVAVEVHQTSATSSDVSMDLILDCQTASPVKTKIVTDNPLSLTLNDDYTLHINIHKHIPVQITEIYHSPAATTDEQYIELHNSALYTIDLSHFKLEGSVEYTFPEGSKIECNQNLVISANGFDESHQWTSGSLSTTGQISLLDNTLSVIDHIEYTNQSPWPTITEHSGQSIYLINFTTDNSLPENWSASVATPNNLSAQQPIDGIIINEVLADNTSVYPTEQLKYTDWIELYNTTDNTIDLAGCIITDGNTNYIIPQGYTTQTAIAPHSYLILFADNNPALGALHTNFAISKSGEIITLLQIIDNQTHIIDQLTVPALATNKSFGRIDGSTQTFNDPTPMTENRIKPIDPVEPINEIGEQIAQINIYPNPATNYISITSTEPIERINIYANNGQLLRTTSSHIIDLTPYASGPITIETITTTNRIISTIIKY